MSTLSVQSNLQISPLQNWPNFENLGSNFPQDYCNMTSQGPLEPGHITLLHFRKLLKLQENN